MSLKRSYLLLWLSTFVLYISNGVSVAPGDFDAECIGLETRIPVSPNEKVLLDTQYYRSQNLITIEGESDIWKSIDFDGIDNDGTYNQVSFELYASKYCMIHNYWEGEIYIIM